MVKLSYNHQIEAHLYVVGNMVDGEMLAENEYNPENPLDNEDDNLRDGEIWVDLNDSQDNKS